MGWRCPRRERSPGCRPAHSDCRERANWRPRPATDLPEYAWLIALGQPERVPQQCLDLPNSVAKLLALIVCNPRADEFRADEFRADEFRADEFCTDPLCLGRSHDLSAGRIRGSCFIAQPDRQHRSRGSLAECVTVRLGDPRTVEFRNGNDSDPISIHFAISIQFADGFVPHG